MTIQSWLWLAVCKWCKIQEIHIFKLNKIYLQSRRYFTSSNCIVMQLQGIVFIQLQENDILVNWQGNIDSFKAHIFIQKSIIIRGNYILTRNYIHFKEPYQFVQGNISSFNETYSFGEIISFKEICSFKEHIFVQVQGHMFIQGNYIYWTLLYSRNSRNIY